MTRAGFLTWVVLGTGVACSPAQTLFAVGSNGELHSVDPGTAVTTLVGPTAPANALVGLGHDGTSPIALGYAGALTRLSPASGAPTSFGNTGLGGWQTGTYDLAGGRFLGIRPAGPSNTSSQLYAIDLAANATPLTAVGTNFGVTAIAVDPLGVIWISRSSTTGTIGTLNPLSGTYTPVVNLPLANLSALAFHPATGALLAAATWGGANVLLNIDLPTAQMALVGTLGIPSFQSAAGLAWGPTPAVPATLVSVGTGCPGTNGTPYLSSAAGALPTLGNAAFTLQVQNAPPGALTGWFLAAGATPAGSVVAPGCVLHLDLASALALLAVGLNPLAVVAADASGYAALPFPVPASPALAGAAAAVQVSVVDATLPWGFTLTNALRATLGT